MIRYYSCQNYPGFILPNTRNGLKIYFFRIFMIECKLISLQIKADLK
jgi:hypothetical protein